MKVQNVRKDCFDFNSSFLEEGPKREQMALKVKKFVKSIRIKSLPNKKGTDSEPDSSEIK